MRLGGEILEVTGWGSYTFNGVASADLPSTVSGCPMNYLAKFNQEYIFQVHLGEEQQIIIKTFKDLVSVKIENPSMATFGESIGLMGDFETGRLLARDGVTVLDDPNIFGQEWQVSNADIQLFESASKPQYPQKCILPDAAKAQRRRL